MIQLNVMGAVAHSKKDRQGALAAELQPSFSRFAESVQGSLGASGRHPVLLLMFRNELFVGQRGGSKNFNFFVLSAVSWHTI